MAATSSQLSHDLWVEARQFQIAVTRTSPTTLRVTVSYPSSLTGVDGAVVLLSTTPITQVNFPVDGTLYLASTNLSMPADKIPAGTGAQVIASYSSANLKPLPAEQVWSNGKTTFELEVTGAKPNVPYYASVHPSSELLSYYSIGVQSYPLENDSAPGSRNGAWSGSIPMLSQAPTSPSKGTVYHDLSLGVVQYWTGQAWIPTRTDAILTGPVNPGTVGQTYLIGGHIMIFDGRRWVKATSANLQLKTPTGFLPIVSFNTVTRAPTNPPAGSMFWDYTAQRAVYFDGSTWVVPSATTTLFSLPNGQLVPAFLTPLTLEVVPLPTPFVGQLFYNTTTQSLNVWTGDEWVTANTDQDGTATQDKVGVGTDGSYEERSALIGVLKRQLGYPIDCLELTEEHFNVSIDNALDNLRQWTGTPYRTSYIMFPLIRGQQVYYLNSRQDKTSHIVDVVRIHRVNAGALGAFAQGYNSVWASGILTAYYNGGMADILSSHLFASYGEEIKRIYAGDMTFSWDEVSRELFLTRSVNSHEKVILECTTERTEQELLTDRWCRQFLQNWALAEAKMQLGLIRSKFSSGTPGPAGTISLNGDLLISEARQDMTELKEEAMNYEFGGLIGHGNISFMIG